MTENDVIDAVARYLEQHGFRINQRCSTRQRGVDLEVERDDQIIRIEAKGGTSSLAHTRRHGRPFNIGQVESHVARAAYKALTFYGQRVTPGIALPDDPLHHAKVKPLFSALTCLGVVLFWVSHDDLTVRSDPPLRRTTSNAAATPFEPYASA